ncbi:MAG: HEAT repeat domain-containing protein [Deltaproteobacteria bacterium]
MSREVLAERIAEVRHQLSRLGLPAAASWRSGRSEAEVDAAFAQIPFTPPTSLRDWFVLQDGCAPPFEDEIFPGGAPLTLEAALQRYALWQSLNQPDFEFRPPAVFPIFAVEKLEYGIDCSDGPSRGQVLKCWFDELPSAVLDRLEDLLAAITECYAEGAYAIEHADEVDQDFLTEDEHRAPAIWTRHREGWRQTQLAAMRAGIVDWWDEEQMDAVSGLGDEAAAIALDVLERAWKGRKVPLCALNAVCESPTPEAEATLTAILADPSQSHLAPSVVEGLRRLATPTAHRTLLDRLERRSTGTPAFDPTRGAIAHAFRDHPSDDIALAAVPLLRSSDADLRMNVAILLGDVRSSHGVAPLVRALLDPEENVAMAAARALGEIGDAHAAGPLIEAFELGLENHRQKLEAGFLRGMAEASVVVRAAHALTRLDAPQAAPLLASVVHDLELLFKQRSTVRHAIAAAFGGAFLHTLARWGHPTDAVALGQWLKRTREIEASAPNAFRVRMATDLLVETLTTLGDPIAEGIVRDWFEAQQSWRRTHALRRMSASTTPWSIDLRCEWSAHPDVRVRTAAVEALAGLKDDAAIGALVVATEDDHPVVRWHACRSLGATATPRAIPALTEAIGDPNDGVASAAYEALFATDPEAARAVDTAERAVLEAVRRALED